MEYRTAATIALTIKKRLNLAGVVAMCLKWTRMATEHQTAMIVPERQSCKPDCAAAMSLLCISMDMVVTIGHILATADCIDKECQMDPSTTKAGICGCSTPDVDTDCNGVKDCHDECKKDLPFPIALIHGQKSGTSTKYKASCGKAKT